MAARVGVSSPRSRRARSNSLSRLSAGRERPLPSESPATPRTRRAKAGKETQPYVVNTHQRPGANTTSNSPERTTGTSTANPVTALAHGPISSTSSSKNPVGPTGSTHTPRPRFSPHASTLWSLGVRLARDPPHIIRSTSSLPTTVAIPDPRYITDRLLTGLDKFFSHLSAWIVNSFGHAFFPSLGMSPIAASTVRSIPLA